MKKLQRRTLFVLLFILALAAGTVVLCAFYVKDGAQWASFYGNQHVYTNGRIASGSIQDRNGTTLFDCAEGQYSDDKTTRISTLHAIGDKQGNINTGAKNLFADQLVGFSLITGTSGTGNTIKLTLDANLNNAAYQAMAGRKGVAALYNYETGEVLCMLSTPSFDPADDAEAAKVAAGDSNYDGAYLNRFLSGTYTPGSTFKLCTSVAALEEGIITPTTIIQDKGIYTYYKDPQPMCWIWRQARTTHGRINVSQAIVDSCNYFYYEVGRLTGIKKLDEYATAFGLGQHTGIEIGDESGVLASPEWAETHDREWTDGQTITAAIGQSYNLFTPLQLANYVATLVSGGEHYEAHLLKNVKSYDNSRIIDVYDKGTLNEMHISESTMAAVTKGMHDLTHDSLQGAFSRCVVEAGAKTGSAQVGTDIANGTFVAYAPYDDPEIAIAIVVEKGGSGSLLANAAVDIINAWFTRGGSSASLGENTLLQ